MYSNARPLIALMLCLTLAILAGCRNPTLLGHVCTLEKSGPDGGQAVPITLDDIKDISNQDLISFGSLDCDADACIVDASSLEAARADAVHHQGAILGYCSRPCTVGTTSECSPQADDAQKVRGKAMTCRQLLLDQATIQALCTSDAECEKYFGSTKDKVTPNFCARGSADAGT